MNDELEERQTQVTFFNSLVPRATEALQEPCLVCFDDIESASITKCGHIFCTRWYVDHALVFSYSLSLSLSQSLSRLLLIQALVRHSIRAAVQAQGKCPMCRAALQLSDVSVVAADGAGAPRAQFDELTNQHGVKMAALIRYLRQILSENDENRAIVFSQWDNMLLRIGDTLGSEVCVICARVVVVGSRPTLPLCRESRACIVVAMFTLAIAPCQPSRRLMRYVLVNLKRRLEVSSR